MRIWFWDSEFRIWDLVSQKKSSYTCTYCSIAGKLLCLVPTSSLSPSWDLGFFFAPPPEGTYSMFILALYYLNIRIVSDFIRMYRSFILSEFRYMYVSITFTVSDIFDLSWYLIFFFGFSLFGVGWVLDINGRIIKYIDRIRSINSNFPRGSFNSLFILITDLIGFCFVWRGTFGLLP